LLAVPPPMTPRQKRPPAPFPLTIVTGFLGAGETSLLNALLRDPALAGTKGEATAGALLDAEIYDPDRKISDVRRWLNAEALRCAQRITIPLSKPS
jgi:CobW/HypB/UreG, nucleotide-binding domain